MPGRTSLAMIFDFDDTLTDDSTAALLTANKIDPARFFKNDVNRLVREEGWDPAPAYLHLLLKYIETGKIKQATNSDLRAFGGRLKPYQGLAGFLKDLRKIAASYDREIKFYIVSGGIQDIIEGFKLRSEFAAVWGCQLAADQPGGPVKYVKRVVTFTEKTRYLFEINKGIPPEESARNPYLVNEVRDERPVPFTNMVYLGDGLTDVPCMSLIEKGPTGPGLAFGVFHPEDQESAKDAWVRLLAPKRVRGIAAPRYGPRHTLGSQLRAIIRERCVFLQARENR